MNIPLFLLHGIGRFRALLAAVVFMVAVSVALVAPLSIFTLPLLLSEQVGGSFAVPLPVYVTAQSKTTAPENPFWPVTVILSVLPVVAPAVPIVNADAESVKDDGGGTGAVVTVTFIGTEVSE